MTKISALSDIGTSVAANDVFVLVDVSDPTTPNKKIQQQNLFLVPDGDATTPGIRFLSDTNTGIYRPSSDTLAISTNGAGRLFVNSSGQVGIGIAPNRTIDTYVTGTSQAILRLSDVDSRNVELRSPSPLGALAGVGTVTNHDFIGFTGNTERLRITSAGLVGIGTSAPQGNLHVVGSSATAGVGNINISNAAFPTSGWALRIPDSGTTIDLSLDGAIGGTWRSVMYFARGTGNVGIGTTGPQRLLHLHQSADTSIKLTNGTTGTSNTDGLDITMGGGDGVTAYITNREAGAIVVENNGSEAFRVDSSRRLLVGTSSDSGGALLQVNGDRIRVGTAKTPASATDTGTAGEICWDANYIYVCTATNTWKRSALSTW